MSIDPNAELVRFGQFIAAHVARGQTLSPEEALDLWRLENPNDQGFEDSAQAITQALADMDAGDEGVSIEEFDRAFRQRHGLPACGSM